MPSAKSALFIETPEADALVSPYRRRPGWDVGSHKGIPHHITITIPFVPPAEITGHHHRILSEIGASTSEFSYSLTEVCTFPSALWLRPEPENPFRALVRDAVKHFPDYPPFGGVFDVVQPHVTLALHVAEEERLQEMRAVAEKEIGPQLPLTGCRARQLALYIRDENGQWSLGRSYPFKNE